MPPKKKKAKSRRKFRGINLLIVAEAYALTNIWTEAAFQTNPIEFLTGTVGGAYNPGRDGSQVITLPELLGAGPGGFGGTYAGTAGKYDNFTNSVMTNVGGLPGLAKTGLKTAGVSIGFRLVSKLTRRPRSMLNRQLKNFGIGDMVRV